MGTNHSRHAADVAELDRPAPGRQAGATAVPASPARPAARMRFSVIVPLYNKRPYIRVALQSVLAQTLQDLEVVVVDDGSTDGGAEIVEAIADPRVRLLRQPNAGVSVARNTAIRQARGDWVVFLDADDWQHPQLLAVLQSVQQVHPDVDCVAARYLEFQGEGGAPPAPWSLPDGRPPVERIDDLAARWMRGATLFTGSVAVRRSLLQAMQPCFRPGESFGEDLELWFRISERTPIALAHVPLAGYRTAVQGSLTASWRSRTLPPWIERMRLRVCAEGYDPARRRSALALIAQFRLNGARDALAEGERARALALLLQARPAMHSRRWWFTAFLACWPTALVRHRLRRGQPAPPQVGTPGVLQLS